MFRSAIVKLTAICNIDCRYCYMFNQLDKTYTRMPPMMSTGLARTLLDRICDYHPVSESQPFSIVLHGGEPLLWPEEAWLAWLDDLASRRDQGWKLEVAVQSNLVRLPSFRLCEAFIAAGVSLGVSLDGPRDWNDAMRVDRRGRGTYDKVMGSVTTLQQRGQQALIGGFLSVATPGIQPRDYLDWVSQLPIPKVDVLWPIEFNWQHPPWSPGTQSRYHADPVYGKWFSQLFTAWWERDDPGITIRVFNNLLQVLLGGHDHIDLLVNDTYNMFVVNTDGSIEYPDYLRNAADGSARTAFSLEQNAICDLHDDPGFATLLALGEACPAKCTRCRHHAICGGGFLAGRSDPVTLVSARESVLCSDQMHFFDTVTQTLHAALRERGHHAGSNSA